MKDIIDRLQSKKILLKSIKPISTKELGTRKKVNIYLGVDLKKYYWCIIQIDRKSRILQKEAKELMQLHKKLEEYNESVIKRKYIYIKAPLCSKAKALFKKEGWTLIESTLT